jgi:hypothetical protein
LCINRLLLLIFIVIDYLCPLNIPIPEESLFVPAEDYPKIRKAIYNVISE